MNNISHFEIDPISKLPFVFDLPIMDYSASKVYCKGFFREPTAEELNRSTGLKPIGIFVNVETHGWKMYFYSLGEIRSIIAKRREI